MAISSVAGGVAGAAYWNADAAPDDHYSKVTIGYGYLGAIVRVKTTGSTKNFYLLYLNSSRTTLNLSKFIEGSETSIGTAISGTYNLGDTMELAVVGSSLRIIYNDSVLDTRSDGDLATGSFGIYSRTQSGGAYAWEGGVAV
jgi:hypothetical protein